MLSHASNNATGVTWPYRDVDAESCWWRCCRANSVVMRCKCRVIQVMMLQSHAGDGAATQGCTGHIKVAQPPSIKVLL
jgi:hypothetical protein